MFEFDAGVGGCEAPVWLGVIFISVILPGGDLVSEDLLIGDAAVEALGRQDAEFQLRQIEPAAVLWRVMPFEPLDQPPGFGGREGLVERSFAVGVEIVLDQNIVRASEKWISAKSFKT